MSEFAALLQAIAALLWLLFAFTALFVFRSQHRRPCQTLEEGQAVRTRDRAQRVTGSARQVRRFHPARKLRVLRRSVTLKPKRSKSRKRALFAISSQSGQITEGRAHPSCKRTGEVGSPDSRQHRLSSRPEAHPSPAGNCRAGSEVWPTSSYSEFTEVLLGSTESPYSRR